MTDHTKLAALVAKWREDAAKYRSRQAECTDKNNHESATQWRLAAQDCETHIHELEAALAAEHSGAVEPKGDLLDPDAIATVCRDLGELESDGWIVAGVARKIIQLTTPPADDSQSTGAGDAIGWIHEIVWPDGTSHRFSTKPPKLTMRQLEERDGIPIHNVCERVFQVCEYITPPADAVAVDDAMVRRACEAFYVDDGWKNNDNRAFDFMRAALTAALNPAEGGK